MKFQIIHVYIPSINKITDIRLSKVYLLFRITKKINGEFSEMNEFPNEKNIIGAFYLLNFHFQFCRNFFLLRDKYRKGKVVFR